MDERRRSATCTTCTRAAQTSVRSARTSTRSGTSRRTTSRSSTTCSTTPRPGSAPWARASCATAGEDVGFISARLPQRPHRPHPRELGGSLTRCASSSSSAATAASPSTTSTSSSASASSTVASRRTSDGRADDSSASTTCRSRRATSQPRVGGDGAAQAPLRALPCTASAGRPPADVGTRRARRGGRHAGGRAVAGEQRRARHRGARGTSGAGNCRSRSLTSPPSSAPWRASCRRRSGARSRGPTGSSGAEVDAFERDFAAYCEVPYAVGVDSGLSALELVLRAAGVGPGDEVITAANTFIATVLAISQPERRPSSSTSIRRPTRSTRSRSPRR